jgi:hypothetical protein
MKHCPSPVPLAFTARLRRGWRHSRGLLLALLLVVGGVGHAVPTATTLSIADGSALEPAANGTVNMTFTVNRTGDLGSQITVGYTTAAGTAQANTDFTPTTGSTTFASGSNTATISIPIFGNGVYNNPSLSFTVQLTGIVDVVGPPVTLAGRSDFGAGTAPRFVAVGDLNGDGKPDLAVANFNSDTVSVLLNTTAPGAATSTFALQQTFSTGAKPDCVAIGDLNGDGRPDLAVTNFNAANVSVLLNTTAPGATTPTFAAQQAFATGTNPFSVAMGDLNGDGRADLAVTNSASSTVSVLLNTTAPGATTPTFAAQQTFATGNNPVSVAIGDLNGDGRPELAVANNNSANVSVLLNTTVPGATTVTFATQQTFSSGTNPVSIAIGDLNGDGRPELAVVNSNAATAAVLLNTTAPGAATLTFAPRQTFATGNEPFSVAIRDLNGDGRPDLATASFFDDTVSVLLNTTAPGAAAPTFAVQLVFDTGTRPQSVALGDFNGDGRPDVATANSGSSNVSVLLNTTALFDAAAGFAAALPFATGSFPESVVVGDLNGDGKPDIATANSSPTAISVLLNTTSQGTATPSFAAPATFATATRPFSLAIGDFNGDGRLDLAFARLASNTVSVLLNTTAPGAATPSFAAEATFSTGTRPISVAIGDFNGDGRADLAVANAGSGVVGNLGNVSVLLNTTAPGAATPTFATQQAFATGTSPASVAIGDFNGDGRSDLAVANAAPGNVSVLLNTTTPGAATPTFATQQTYALGSLPGAAVVGDLNGDGKPDLAVANTNSNTVSVLLNTTIPGGATSSFSAQQTFAAGSDPSSVEIADLNGDGKPDLAVANYFSNLSVLVNTTAPGATTPSFATQQTFDSRPNTPSVAIGDFNGDSRPDLAVVNEQLSTAAVLLNARVSISRSIATGTITESTPPPTVQFSAASENVAQTAGTFSITVALSGASDADTTVPFTLGGTAVAGTDFSGVTASPLVITKGQISRTITGTLLTAAPAAGKTIIFTLGTPTNATLGATTTNTLTIVAGAPALITTLSGTPQSTVANTDFVAPLVAEVFDAAGNPVPGATVTFTAPNTGASTAVISAAAMTDASGQASQSASANAVLGAYTVAATVPGAPDAANFELTNLTPALADTGFTSMQKGIEIDVLANDVPGGTGLAIATQPQHGRAVVTGGKIAYVPTGPLPIGGDSFTYTYTDAKGSTFTATVTIVNFAALVGTYDGLIKDSSATPGTEAHQRAGYLRVRVSKTGIFSGVLTLAGSKLSPIARLGFRSFGFYSVLGSAGGAAPIILRRPQAPIALTLNFDPATRTITGTAASTDSASHAFTSTLTLEAETSPGTRAGSYTMLIDPDATPGAPRGTGFAAVNLGATGAVRVAGTLADGTPFSSATSLHPDLAFPIYARIYPGAFATLGSLRGTVQFPVPPPLVGDASGSVDWFKPVRRKDAHFPNGFTLNHAVRLARYERPPAGTRVLALDPVLENGRILISASGFATIDENFTLLPGNRAVASPPNATLISLHFNVASGIFRGSFINPVNTRFTPFGGAVFQADVSGAGFFLGAGPNDAGKVTLGKSR